MKRRRPLNVFVAFVRNAYRRSRHLLRRSSVDPVATAERLSLRIVSHDNQRMMAILRAMAAHLDAASFDECGSLSQWLDSLANTYNLRMNQAQEIQNRLREERDTLKRNAWAFDRGLAGCRAYSAADFREMFAPFVESGSVDGLNPREARLCETVIELAAVVAGLRAPEADESIDWQKNTRQPTNEPA